MKVLRFVCISVLLIAIASCGGLKSPLTPGDGSNSSTPVVSQSRLVSGNATFTELKQLYYAYNNRRSQAPPTSGGSDGIITMSQTGRLKVTLRDNNAGWRSELYIEIDANAQQLIADTRLGPLDTVTEFEIASGTGVDFYIITHAVDIYGQPVLLTYRADSAQCIVEQTAANKWRMSWEDTPGFTVNGYTFGTPDWDFNDVVIEVEIAPDNVLPEFIDLSDKLDVNVEYLGHHGYNAQGYAIYYIGENWSYAVGITALEDDDNLTGEWTVYAIHEYLDSITCNRYWYPSPPRPANEPQEISVVKGDPLPGQDPPQSWEHITLPIGQKVTLTGNVAGSYAVCAGNDQTHVIICKENDNGDLLLTIFDNPEAGVFDPPAGP